MPTYVHTIPLHRPFDGFQGCDGSVLLDDTPIFTGEKTAPPNLNGLRDFDVVDSTKASVEAACPGVVSCADLISHRPGFCHREQRTWCDVRLGRRDSLTASLEAVEQFIPNPNDDVDALKSSFATLGLSTWNLGGDLNVTTGLDVQTPTTFDNAYYQNLVVYKGILNSDEVLVSAAEDTRTIVQQFALDKPAFFAASMIAMQILNVIEAPAGEIRTNCRFVN
ncbi:hypothetical protein AXG93_3756s1010 [Marchantia polymorpha subsp. ruderalis]|uniref:Plant heme peroxidase family profile domain-containing protein n=1 Tax=Marchantia polymorpha subsp. ruderalis TaxID=1480154 RepID=A0A176VI44_MARPO|nr:hypothetical protein AXG93_3756s1010 [Marchantia polymorpha subsp. ruderalis]